jgi:hypothetical protein
MTPDLLFSIANPLALIGWLALAAGIVFNRPFWRDTVAGLYVPLILAVGYTLLILIFWWNAEGGFGSLADVQTLFTQGWIALAGWVHYLAYDLFIGALVSRRIIEAKLSRLYLIPILPLAFLFGPIGFLAAQALLLTRKGDAQ